MTDLSGTWLGTYWQMGTQTRFEMTLSQNGNALAGNILDNVLWALGFGPWEARRNGENLSLSRILDQSKDHQTVAL